MFKVDEYKTIIENDTLELIQILRIDKSDDTVLIKYDKGGNRWFHINTLNRIMIDTVNDSFKNKFVKSDDFNLSEFKFLQKKGDVVVVLKEGRKYVI